MSKRIKAKVIFPLSKGFLWHIFPSSSSAPAVRAWKGRVLTHICNWPDFNHVFEHLHDVITNVMRSPGVLMYLQGARFILIRILEFNADGNISGLNKADKS